LVTFFSFRVCGELLAVGALKRLDSHHAEVRAAVGSLLWLPDDLPYRKVVDLGPVIRVALGGKSCSRCVGEIRAERELVRRFGFADEIALGEVAADVR
jgi:hypothetical protein